MTDLCFHLFLSQESWRLFNKDWSLIRDFRPLDSSTCRTRLRSGVVAWKLLYTRYTGFHVFAKNFFSITQEYCLDKMSPQIFVALTDTCWLPSVQLGVYTYRSLAVKERRRFSWWSADISGTVYACTVYISPPLCSQIHQLKIPDGNSLNHCTARSNSKSKI